MLTISAVAASGVSGFLGGRRAGDHNGHPELKPQT